MIKTSKQLEKTIDLILELRNGYSSNCYFDRSKEEQKAVDNGMRLIRYLKKEQKRLKKEEIKLQKSIEKRG